MCRDRDPNSEVQRPAELFQSVNLVHYTHADKARFTGILTNGLRPRNGHQESNSFYPDVISLSAVYPPHIRHRALERNKLIVTGNTIRDVGFPYSPKEFHNYIILIDPNWVANNIQHFLGVGAIFFSDETKSEYLFGALSLLPVRRLETHTVQSPFDNEVQFTNGALPVESFAGIMIDEDDQQKTEQARINLVNSVDDRRQEGSCIPQLALYSRRGEIDEMI